MGSNYATCGCMDPCLVRSLGASLVHGLLYNIIGVHASSQQTVPTLSQSTHPVDIALCGSQYASVRLPCLIVHIWKTNCSNWLLGGLFLEMYCTVYVCKTCSRLCNSRSFKFIRRQNAPKYVISRHQIQKFSPDLSPMGRRQSLPTPNHPRRLDPRAFGTCPP